VSLTWTALGVKHSSICIEIQSEYNRHRVQLRLYGNIGVWERGFSRMIQERCPQPTPVVQLTQVKLSWLMQVKEAPLLFFFLEEEPLNKFLCYFLFYCFKGPTCIYLVYLLCFAFRRVNVVDCSLDSRDKIATTCFSKYIYISKYDVENRNWWTMSRVTRDLVFCWEKESWIRDFK